MSEEKQKYIELLLHDKKLKLDMLREEHRIAIATFKAKEEMLERDIATFKEGLKASYSK